MSMDTALTRFPDCGGCSYAVDENDPDRAYTLVNGVHFHSDCAELCLICGEFKKSDCICTEKTKVKHAEYRKAVEGILTVGRDATRDQRPGPFRNDDWPLADEEVAEMEEARQAGVSARQFALTLANRDINEFEKADERRQENDCCRDFSAEFRDSQIEAQALK